MANRNFFLFSSFWVTNGSCLIFKNVKVHIVSLTVFGKKTTSSFWPISPRPPGRTFWCVAIRPCFVICSGHTVDAPAPSGTCQRRVAWGEWKTFKFGWDLRLKTRWFFFGSILKVAYVWHGAAAICTSILALQDAAGQEMHKDEAKKPVWHITPEIWKKQDFFKGPCSPREYLYILQSEHFKKSNATTVKDA